MDPIRASTTSSCCSDLREMNEAKVNNIMSYLESVDHIPPPASNMGRPTTTSSMKYQHNFYVEDPKPMPSSASQMSVCDSNVVYNGIKGKLEHYKQQAQTAQTENASLRQQMDLMKSEYEGKMQQAKDLSSREIDSLKQECTMSTKTSIRKVNELLHEKQELNGTVERLANELKRVRDHHAEEMKKAESAATAAMSELKAKWTGQEKLKREQWALKEAKKIKEATLKAMEPDIAMLMNRHKAEKSRLQEDHALELRRKDEVLSAREKEFNEVKLKLGREFEEMLQKERMSFRQRLEEATTVGERQIADLRRSFTDKKEDMERFHEEQKATLRAEIKELQKQLFELKAKQTESSVNFREAVESEANQVIAEKELMMAKMKIKLEEDAAKQVAEMKSENDKFLAKKTEEIRSNCVAERDAAIAKVIQHLEDEHAKGLSNRREELKVLREKCANMEGMCDRLGVDLSIKAQQVKELHKVVEEKDKEIASLQGALEHQKKNIENLQSAAEKEFCERLQYLNSEWQMKVRRMENEHVEHTTQLQADAKKWERNAGRAREEMEAEIRSIEQRHSAELSSVNDRVLITISKKDAVIAQLTQQVETQEHAIATRDQELERHRQLLMDGE